MNMLSLLRFVGGLIRPIWSHYCREMIPASIRIFNEGIKKNN